MTVEDALAAVNCGADAIWVSNQSGRTLDALPSTISVLPIIAKAVKATHPKVEIYLDSGVRRGTDVLKALALGATAVFLGQPIAWGLNFGGKEGVSAVLNTISEELKTAMILTDSMEVAQVTEDQVIHKVTHFQPRL